MNSVLQTAVADIGPRHKGSLRVGFAESFTDIRDAQRLRYDVFAREMGACLHNPLPGLDQDHFDDYCVHLLVRDSDTQKVVGCTRILTDQRARDAGGFYSQTEFDLGSILTLPGRFMEIGRTCIHADYRNGATLAALWSGLAAFIAEHGFDYLIGCASIPLGEDDGQAQAIIADLSQHYLTPEQFRVKPFYTLPPRGRLAGVRYTLPPLLRAYLRMGAQIGGEPCLDVDFGVADLFILLPTRHLDRRYARHFMGKVQ